MIVKRDEDITPGKENVLLSDVLESRVYVNFIALRPWVPWEVLDNLIYLSSGMNPYRTLLKFYALLCLFSKNIILFSLYMKKNVHLSFICKAGKVTLYKHMFLALWWNFLYLACHSLSLGCYSGLGSWFQCLFNQICIFFFWLEQEIEKLMISEDFKVLVSSWLEQTI